MSDTESTPDHRTAAEHSTDRILYSDGFRRLGGVTQVVAVGENSLFHTRLTHTLKVAQIARRLAEHLTRQPGEKDAEIEALGGLDPAAAEAAGLAHDLGHPPFGHVGEGALNERCQSYGLDGFEGNAQTFRLVTKLLRAGDYLSPGLDLDARSLNAIVKYPWLREGDHADAIKWNAYKTERAAFDAARPSSHGTAQSLEAAIMDWADDITYAIHDLEDFIRAGRVPVDRLLGDPQEMENFLRVACGRIARKKRDFDAADAGDRFKKLVTIFLSDARHYRGTTADLAEMQQASKTLINRFVSAATLGTVAAPIAVPTNIHDEVAILKELTWYYVIHNPALATMQEGHRVIVRDLFERLMEWIPRAESAGEWYRLPARLLDLWRFTEREEGWEEFPKHPENQPRRARAVADYISSLTEAQAVDLYNRFTGRTGQSVLDPWMGY